MPMTRYLRNSREKGRRKTQWELILNPTVTMIVVAFCIGILLVWIGMFEHRVNPEDGVVSSGISDVYAQIINYVDSIRK